MAPTITLTGNIVKPAPASPGYLMPTSQRVEFTPADIARVGMQESWGTFISQYLVQLHNGTVLHVHGPDQDKVSLRWLVKAMGAVSNEAVKSRHTPTVQNWADLDPEFRPRIVYRHRGDGAYSLQWVYRKPRRQYPLAWLDPWSKEPDGPWHVQIQMEVRGDQPVTLEHRHFPTREEADTWARQRLEDIQP